jgi:rubrerythrin
MNGAIRKRDILAQPFVTIHCFGWLVFFRALVAGRNQTFLSLLAETHKPPPLKVRNVIERCIKMEEKVKSIYERLAVWFTGRAAVKEFFDELARQEQSHAELLELCQRSVRRESKLQERFRPLRDTLSRVEKQMERIESSLESVGGLADVLRLVLWIERSEINTVFRGVVAATGSEFVRTVRTFHTAGARHITFICDEIPKLEPDLAEECRDLKDRFFADSGD